MRGWGWGTRAVVTAALLLGACGSEESDRNERPLAEPGESTTTTIERQFSFRSWFDASFAGSTSKVTLHFDAPRGPGCDEQHEAVVEKGDDAVVVFVRFFAPFVPLSCPLEAQSLLVDLGEPLGERRLKDLGDDTAFRDEGGRLVLIPETTPCGRADCSTPAPVPAPCTKAAYDEAVKRGIDGGIRSRDERCDGSFLILTLMYDSACQPEEPRNEGCARFKRAFFVSKNGDWQILTYGDGDTCDTVRARTRVRFPPAMCD